jgi:O-antigen/teichoic acid export membrane protein
MVLRRYIDSSMINKANKKDIAWGYLSQFLNVGAGIVLIPVAIKCLSAEDMGLWYVFLALAGLAQLLEFGFQPTISRQTSYVYSGAMKLQPQGIPINEFNVINKQLLANLIFASKKLYKYVAICSCLILLVFGTLYIYSLNVTQVSSYIAWVVFSFSSVINFYFSYYNGLMQGRGQQTTLNKIITQSKVILLVVAVPLLLLDFGLLALAVATLISMIVNRFLVHNQFYDNSKEETYFIKNANITEDLTNLLFLSSWRLGLTSLGAFLIQKANLFIASSFLGLKIAGSYGLTIQLIGILSMVSSMSVNLNIPKITALNSNNKKDEIIVIFQKSMIMAISLFIAGSVAIIFAGLPMISFLSDSIELVTLPILVLMLLFQLLEMIHSLSATYLTTLNYVPFARSALMSGGAIIILSLLSVNFTSFGLITLVLSQGVVQLAFNNWYWPLQAHRSLSN